MEPIFECDNCLRQFARKSHLEQHKNKKKPCFKQSKIIQNNPNPIQNNPKQSVFNHKNIVIKKSIIEENKYLKNEEKIQEEENNISCGYCKKIFLNKSNLNKHLNSNCKVKRENDNEKENIFKLLLEKDKQKEVEINELKKQNKILMDKIDKLIQIKDKSKHKTINNNQKITNNTNNNNSVNTQNNTQNNNIIMVNFGKEDLSIIDEKQFIDRVVKKPLLSGVKIPDEVLKIIHFNPQYPQLSNIYISDINREKCMVFEDGEWVLSSVDNIPQIMDKICIFSNEQINMLKTKYPNNKPLLDRLDIIEKYNNLIDVNFLEDLKDDNDDGINQNQIARCEEFQKYTYSIFKNTLYNEGKKIKQKK